MKVGSAATRGLRKGHDGPKKLVEARKLTAPKRNVESVQENILPALKIRLDATEVPVIYPGCEIRGQVILVRDIAQDADRLEITLTAKAVARWWQDAVDCFYGQEKFLIEKNVVWAADDGATQANIRIPLTVGTKGRSAQSFLSATAGLKGRAGENEAVMKGLGSSEVLSRASLQPSSADSTPGSGLEKAKKMLRSPKSGPGEGLRAVSVVSSTDDSIASHLFNNSTASVITEKRKVVGLPAGTEWSFRVTWPFKSKEIYPPSTTPDGLFVNSAFDEIAGVFYSMKAKLFVKSAKKGITAQQPNFLKTRVYFPCRGCANIFYAPLGNQLIQEQEDRGGSMGVIRQTLVHGKFQSTDDMVQTATKAAKTGISPRPEHSDPTEEDSAEWPKDDGGAPKGPTVISFRGAEESDAPKPIKATSSVPPPSSTEPAVLGKTAEAGSGDHNHEADSGDRNQEAGSGDHKQEAGSGKDNQEAGSGDDNKQAGSGNDNQEAGSGIANQEAAGGDPADDEPARPGEGIDIEGAHEAAGGSSSSTSGVDSQDITVQASTLPSPTEGSDFSRNPSGDREVGGSAARYIAKDNDEETEYTVQSEYINMNAICSPTSGVWLSDEEEDLDWRFPVPFKSVAIKDPISKSMPPKPKSRTCKRDRRTKSLNNRSFNSKRNSESRISEGYHSATEPSEKGSEAASDARTRRKHPNVARDLNDAVQLHRVLAASVPIRITQPKMFMCYLPYTGSKVHATLTDVSVTPAVFYLNARGYLSSISGQERNAFEKSPTCNEIVRGQKQAVFERSPTSFAAMTGVAPVNHAAQSVTIECTIANQSSVARIRRLTLMLTEEVHMLGQPVPAPGQQAFLGDYALYPPVAFKKKDFPSLEQLRQDWYESADPWVTVELHTFDLTTVLPHVPPPTRKHSMNVGNADAFGIPIGLKNLARRDASLEVPESNKVSPEKTGSGGNGTGSESELQRTRSKDSNQGRKSIDYVKKRTLEMVGQDGAVGPGKSRQIKFTIPDINEHLQALQNVGDMRAQSFSNLDKQKEQENRAKQGRAPLGVSSVCSPVFRRLHYITFWINAEDDNACTKKEKIGQIPVCLVDKNVEDRMLWQSKYGLLCGKTVEDFSADGTAKKRIKSPWGAKNEIIMKRNPLSAPVFQGRSQATVIPATPSQISPSDK